MLTKLSESVRLTRDCEGVLIPAGTKTILPAGSTVVIKQSLGGDYTVRTDCGDQVLIASCDADALGKQSQDDPSTSTTDAPYDEKAVWKALGKVYDPEIPISIVELGLVYDVDSMELPDKSHRVYVRMTLTAPGCGMGEILKQDVERKVRAVPGVSEAHVEIVFDPAWNQSMMSDAAKLQLGFF